MREAGITSADLAEAISRDRAVVSRILNGHQMLKTDQAEKFADALKLPLQDVVDHAGLFSRTTAHITVSGFSEGDVAPYSHKYTGCEDATEKMANALGPVDNHPVALARRKFAASVMNLTAAIV
ncbi:hypothetical protein MNBD_ALPHA07-1732 [hydrothermal vent metagenome]|uniref:HTH cro/C1-type domain-containing protein n=1 Tax=hydrothermal vent metagenome TaxID=652676 RepID=A0A3B0SJF3_9ZZZZ